MTKLIYVLLYKNLEHYNNVCIQSKHGMRGYFDTKSLSPIN